MSYNESFTSLSEIHNSHKFTTADKEQLTVESPSCNIREEFEAYTNVSNDTNETESGISVTAKVFPGPLALNSGPVYNLNAATLWPAATDTLRELFYSQ